MSTIKNIKKWIIALTLCSAMVSVSFATTEGFYMGVQIGQSNLNNLPMTVNTGQPNPANPTVPCSTNNNDVATSTCLFVPNVSPDNSGIAERFYAGSNMSKYFGFEVGFTNYANSVYTPNVEGFSHDPQIRVYSVDLLAKGMLSIFNFSAYIKGGVAGVYQSTSPALYLPSDVNKSDPTYSARPVVGVGLGYDITPFWTIEATAFRITQGGNIQEIDFYGVGVTYHWAKEYCGQFLC